MLDNIHNAFGVPNQADVFFFYLDGGDHARLHSRFVHAR